MSIGHLVAVPELAAEGAARLLEQQGELSKIKFLNTGAEMTKKPAVCALSITAGYRSALAQRRRRGERYYSAHGATW